MADDHYRTPRTGALMPCTRCGTPTPAGTLNHLGARCEPCYRAYCGDGGGRGGRELERTLPKRPQPEPAAAVEPFVMPAAIPLPKPRPSTTEGWYDSLPPVALP